MYLCKQRANTITELKMQLVCKKMQCKHALIPTEWHKDFLFQKGKKKKVKPHGSTQDTTLKTVTFRQNR